MSASQIFQTSTNPQAIDSETNNDTTLCCPLEGFRDEGDATGATDLEVEGKAGSTTSATVNGGIGDKAGGNELGVISVRSWPA